MFVSKSSSVISNVYVGYTNDLVDIHLLTKARLDTLFSDAKFANCKIHIVTNVKNVKRCFWSFVNLQPWKRLTIEHALIVPTPYTPWGILHDTEFFKANQPCPCDACSSTAICERRTRFQLIDYSSD